MPKKRPELELSQQQLEWKERFRRRQISGEEVGRICREIAIEINEKKRVEKLIGMIFGQKPALNNIEKRIEGQIIVRGAIIRF